MEYTEGQLTIIKGMKDNFNYKTEEMNLQDNANCIDTNDIRIMLGVSTSLANGFLVFLRNKGIIYEDEVNGSPLYMVTEFGIKEAFRLFPSSNILPCPFCGGEGTPTDLIWEKDANTHITTWIIECSNCEGQTGEFSAKEEAIACWNRRVK